MVKLKLQYSHCSKKRKKKHYNIPLENFYSNDFTEEEKKKKERKPNKTK